MACKLHLFILITVVFIAYYNSTKCGFVFDDISAVRDNKDVRQKTPIKNLLLNDFWGTPMIQERSHKSYRPFCVLTFRINHWFNGLNASGYHFVNVVLHTIVCVQMYFFGCRLLGSSFMSFIASLIFALHPVHTEAVTGVVGRAELLSAIFSFFVLYFYEKSAYKNDNLEKNQCSNQPLKSVNGSCAVSNNNKSSQFLSHDKTSWFYMFLAFICVILATLSKEQGLTIVGVCVIYDIFIICNASLPELYMLVISLINFSFEKVPKFYWNTFKRILFFFITTIILLFFRIRIMGAQLPIFTNFDNPAASLSGLPRILTFNFMLPLNSWLLICPSWLCCDWTMGTIPIIEGLNDFRNVYTLSFYLFFLILFASIIRKSFYSSTSSHCGNSSGVDCSQTFFIHNDTNKIILFLSLIIFPFIPASNLFFPVGFVVAERILYIPSIGYCFLIALGFNKISCFINPYQKNSFNKMQKPYNSSNNFKNENLNTHEHKKNSVLPSINHIFLVICILSFFIKTVHRNEDWLDEETLFISALKVNKRNAKLYNNVGHALENKPDLANALRFFVKASLVQNDDIGAHINVGRTLVALKRHQEAEIAYRKALSLLPPMIPGQNYTTRVSPNHLNVFINLSNLLIKNNSRLLEADQLLRTAISMRTDFYQAYINRGDILMKLNKTIEARQEYIKALKYDPDNADIYYNLGVVLVEMNSKTEAIQYFEKALKLEPDHKPSLLNSAILLQEFGDENMVRVAENRLRKLDLLEPEDEKVHFHMGILKMDLKDFEASREHFERAISIKPSFRSALFNLALLLSNDLQRPLQAVPVLNQLLEHHPNHISGLVLLGNIAINNQKNLKLAEDCFKKVLKLQPKNTQAHHNLCVVYAEKGNLLQALDCLEDLKRRVPDEDYINNHLNILKNKLLKDRN